MLEFLFKMKYTNAARCGSAKTFRRLSGIRPATSAKAVGGMWANDFFIKTQALSCQKSRKNKYKYACGLMTESDTHTHASNDSYEHPPR